MSIVKLDELTNVYTLAYAEQLVGDFLQKAVSNKGVVVSATLDVDYLQQINDEYGWEAGDHVLRYITTVCKEYSPIVTRNDDEITVIWKDVPMEQGVTEATALFKRIQTSTIDWNGEQIDVNVSMGITHNHEGEVHTLKELIATAVTALSKCKDKGRNRFIMDVAPYL